MARSKNRVQDIAEQAKDLVTPVIEDARERVIPAAESAAEQAKATFHDTVLPQAAALVAAAEAASEPYRAEAKRRGAATLAAAKGEIEVPKETHRFRNLVLLLVLGGVVFAVVRYFTKDDSAGWESDYPATGPTPVPDEPVAATTGVAAAGAPAAEEADEADDAAAAGPDEALADSTEHPHRPTDPDNPLERKDL
jgi:hypothetical protein